MLVRAGRQLRRRWSRTGRFLDHRRQGQFGPEADKPAANHAVSVDEDLGGQIPDAEAQGN